MSWKEIWSQAEALTAAERDDLLCRLLGGSDAGGLERLLASLETRLGARARSPAPDLAMIEALKKKEDEPPEPERLDVMVMSPGDAKLRVIKELRALTGLGLREAKARIDAAPSALATDLDREEAERLRGIFEELGAVIELRPHG